jgi:hypothetical protein
MSKYKLKCTYSHALRYLTDAKKLIIPVDETFLGLQTFDT